MSSNCRLVNDQEWLYVTTNDQIRAHFVARWPIYVEIARGVDKYGQDLRHLTVVHLIAEAESRIRALDFHLKLGAFAQAEQINHGILVNLIARMLVWLDRYDAPPDPT